MNCVFCENENFELPVEGVTVKTPLGNFTMTPTGNDDGMCASCFEEMINRELDIMVSQWIKKHGG